MKPGSLIARLPDTNFIWYDTVTLQATPGPFRLPSIAEPVILLEWKFAHKCGKELYLLFIEVYSTAVIDNRTNYYWFAGSAFVELQPPMDMSFIERIQIENVKQLTNYE